MDAFIDQCAGQIFYMQWLMATQLTDRLMMWTSSLIKHQFAAHIQFPPSKLSTSSKYFTLAFFSSQPPPDAPIRLSFSVGKLAYKNIWEGNLFMSPGMMQPKFRCSWIHLHKGCLIKFSLIYQRWLKNITKMTA